MNKSFLTLLQEASEELRARGITYAVVGGVAANYYKTSSRLTPDVDFAIVTKSNSEKVAREIIEHFGFTATSLRKAELDGGPAFAIKNNSSPYQVVVGRLPGDDGMIGLDILLPEMAWVPEAVDRAQSNIVPIAKGILVPVLVVEDVIISKLIAFNSRSSRVKDIEDLQGILQNNKTLNHSLISAEIKKYRLKIPKMLHQYFHHTILRVERKQKGPKL
jgi:predicted nucleotidyltransferase